jgi:transposase
MITGTCGTGRALCVVAGCELRASGERVAPLLEDWTHTHGRLADTAARTLTVLDDLQLSELVTCITGVSTLGAAAIPAHRGDPRRFSTVFALVKQADPPGARSRRRETCS